MTEYNKNNPLRCFFAFEGYNSQGLALNRLKEHYPNFDWICVGRSEIDRYAILAADALFPEAKDRNYGDISKIDWAQVPDFDLFTMSSPCQDFSIAGLQKGGDEGSGTRSSLLWECRKAILAKKPRYILFENVKALMSKKFLPSFRKWQDELAYYGYSNFTKVINAKDYCVPQNRERVFMVSILDEGASFHFPEPFPLERRLKDILEEDVDERYYLSDKCVKGFMEHNRRHLEKVAEPVIAALRGRNPKNPSDRTAGCPTEQRLEIGGDISNTVTTVEKDCLVVKPICLNPKVDGRQPSREHRVYDCGGISTAVMTGFMPKIAEPAVLTPKRNEYGKAVRRKYEAGEIDESRHNMTDLVPRQDGICNTITSVEKDNYVIEPFNTEKDGSDRTITSHYSKTGIFNIMKGFGCGDTGVIQIGNILEEKGFSNPQRGRIYSTDGISPTITTMAGGDLEPKIAQMSSGLEHNNHIVEVGNINPSGKGMNGRVVSDRGIAPTLSTNKVEGMKILSSEVDFRIRKLTEREVFRLMDVSEEDIDRIQNAGISRRQQYKMAGNSIVVACLYHIFRKLFIEQESESQQLTIF